MEESVFGLLSEKYVGEAPRDLPDHDTQEMDMNLSTRSVGHLEQSVEAFLLAANVPAVRLTKIGRSSIYEVMSIEVMQFAD